MGCFKIPVRVRGIWFQQRLCEKIFWAKAWFRYRLFSSLCRWKRRGVPLMAGEKKVDSLFSPFWPFFAPRLVSQPFDWQDCDCRITSCQPHYILEENVSRIKKTSLCLWRWKWDDKSVFGSGRLVERVTAAGFSSSRQEIANLCNERDNSKIVTPW